MKISMTKEPSVSFTQMTPTLADGLIDLASDLAEGRAVLVYADAVYEPSPVFRTELAKVNLAYDRLLGGITEDTNNEGFGRRWTRKEG